MKVAIPVWQSRVSPVFDTAERLLVLDVEYGRELSRVEHPMAGIPPMRRARRLSELGVDVLLCGAISRPVLQLMTASGIRVIPWVSGEINDLLAWYLDGKPLDGRFLMPGCGHRNRFRGSCRRGRARHWANYSEERI